MPTQSEKQFLESFRAKDYRPALLFEDEGILGRIKSHPMAAWKCRPQPSKGIHEQIKNAQQAIQEQKAIQTPSREKSFNVDR